MKNNNFLFVNGLLPMILAKAGYVKDEIFLWIIPLSLFLIIWIVLKVRKEIHKKRIEREVD